MSIDCPICDSGDTRPDFDYPKSMTNCDGCGSEWVTNTGEILLNSRDVI